MVTTKHAQQEPAYVGRALGLLCEDYSFKYLKGMGVGSRCDIRFAFWKALGTGIREIKID